MSNQEAQWLCEAMKKEGWPEVRVEPCAENGYVVAYRRLPDEAHRHARRLSPAMQARWGRDQARAAGSPQT